MSKLVKLAVLLSLAAAPSAARADFDFTLGGGVISYAGGDSPLTGTVAVTSVNAVPAASTLNFTTGNFLGSTPDTWVFGPGGSLTGPVTASFRGDVRVVQTGVASFKVIAGGFTGNDLTGAMTVLFDTPAAPPAGFTSTTVFSGNLVVAPSVPEPSPFALLPAGAGVALAAAGVRRRRRKVEGHAL